MNATTSPTNRLLLLVVLVLLASCNQSPKKDKPEEMEEEIVKEVKRPEDLISLDEAKELCQNYERRRIPGIVKFEAAQGDAEEKFIPTQFVAFDLAKLKEYIKYVEQEASKVNVAPDSLRIYLANYGMEGKDPNHNTLFILPTAKVDGDYGGFYIAGEEAKLIRKYWPSDQNDGQEEDPKSKASFVPSFNLPLLQDDKSLILNHGGSGPPPGTDF
ncbi:MAG: hypothetical protein AAGF96_19500 [Bacteroidota bacterium]